MFCNSDSSPRRERFFDPGAEAPAASHSKRILQLLLAQDGSTTRLCESIAGGAVSLHVRHQAATADVLREFIGRALLGLPVARFLADPRGAYLGNSAGILFLARRDVMAVFRPGDHGSTFGGNPLACAAALAAYLD